MNQKLPASVYWRSPDYQPRKLKRTALAEAVMSNHLDRRNKRNREAACKSVETRRKKAAA